GFNKLTMTNHFIDFFFFQAEDGIRDKLVTGVQTCALPIYMEDADLSLRAQLLGLDVLCAGDAEVEHDYALGMSPQKLYFLERNRSEERRVGKECRRRRSTSY